MSVAIPRIWTPNIHFEGNENETGRSKILGQKKILLFERCFDDFVLNGRLKAIAEQGVNVLLVRVTVDAIFAVTEVSRSPHGAEDELLSQSICG